ncbi:MAG: rod shape-determining protein RodA [Rickettsiales bacterium]|jgi:rod shape determining protein RodA|nr:rod shape-determining protein RodA [Rickettsiales bacterium]
MRSRTRYAFAGKTGFDEKLAKFHWPLLAAMSLVLILSVLTLFSAGHNGDSFGGWRPYALDQLIKILVGLGVFFIAAFSNIRTWLKSVWTIYGIALALIILVTFVGHTGMGATRWINLGFVHIQPSEFIKIALILAFAKYFSWKNSVESGQLRTYLIPLAILGAPLVFILAQPDLGTAISITLAGIGVFWAAGARRQWFAIAAALFILAAPIVWFAGLHDYQRERIITFVHPDQDLAGTGYQINQSKITFGSGGVYGKGYLQGTQSHMYFLPEKQTDFIFAIFGEEFGFAGAMVLILIYSAMTGILFWISKQSKNRFGQLFCFGFMLNFSIYYFINIFMVLGLLPTVGVPLPLMSFGGSALISLMLGLGICQNCNINRDQLLANKG